MNISKVNLIVTGVILSYACWVLPMVTGTLTFLAWVITKNKLFVFIGNIVIDVGVALLVCGVFLITALGIFLFFLKDTIDLSEWQKPKFFVPLFVIASIMNIFLALFYAGLYSKITSYID